MRAGLLEEMGRSIRCLCVDVDDGTWMGEKRLMHRYLIKGDAESSDRLVMAHGWVENG